MTHSKTLKRALAFLMVIVIMFVTIFTDNVVKRVLVRAGDNTEAGNGNDGEGDMPSASPSANPSAAPSAAPGEDETQYPVLGEDINNSATYCNNSNGEINILLDLDKLSDDAVKAEIENAGDIAGVKYKINNTEYDAVKKNDNDNKKWIITIPAYAEENKSEDVTYVINRIVVNDTIEISEYENYSLNVTRNTLAPTIKVMCGDEELINDASKVSNDNIELNVKAVDNNGDELISADDDSKNYKVEYLSLKDNGEEMAEKPEIRENIDKGGFDIVLPKKDNETHKYELTVNVKELVWGNSGKISVTAVIDNAIPKIKVNEKSSDNSGKRVFEVTVTDDRDLYSDFEADKDSLNNLLSVLDDNESAVTDADISAEAGAGNNNVKYNVSINNDKVYSIKAKDLAGNESAITKLDAFELNDLKGLSETETTYIGKDGKVVSFTLSGEVSSVRWGIDNNAFSDISFNDNKYEFNVGDKIAGIADANTHSVDIVITKKDGNTIEKKFNIIVDKDAPTVDIENYIDSDSWVNVSNINETDPSHISVTDTKENAETAESGINSIKVYNVIQKDFDVKKFDNLDEDKKRLISDSETGNEFNIALDNLLDSEYSNIVVVATDNAGNRTIKSTCIKKDTIAPKGTISLIDSDISWENWRNQVTFGIFKKDNAKFSISYKEDGSGLKEAYSYTTGRKDAADKIITDNNITTDEWKSLSFDGENKGTISADKIQGAVIYVKLVDKAGNSTYIRSDGVVIDGAPSVNITYPNDANNKSEWTNDPENVKIYLNASISGFKNYSIDKKLKDEKIKTYTSYNDTSENPQVNPDEKKTTEYVIGTKNAASFLEEGNYTISASVTNRVGETANAETNIKYDATAPKVDISDAGNLKIDDEGILWINNINKDNPTLGLEISDSDRKGADNNNIESSGLERVELRLKERGDADTVSEGNDSNKDKVLVLNFDGKSYSGVISLKDLLDKVEENKAYDMSLVVYDKAGNSTEKPFCIKKDITAPEGKISIIDSDISWENWRNQVTFGIFKKDNAEFSISYKEDGSGLKEVYSYTTGSKAAADKIITDNNITTNEWTSIPIYGSNNLGTIFVCKTLSVVIYVKLVDKAGNSTYIRSDGVVIDGAPSVNIIYPNDANNKSEWTNNPENVKICLNASISGFKNYSIDKKLKDEKIKTYTSYNDTSENPQVNNPDEEETKKYTIGNEKSDAILDEGDYFISASVTNRVGETATAKTEIKYDATAPTIKISDDSLYNDEDKWINYNEYNNKSNEGLIFTVDDSKDGIETSGVATVKIYKTTKSVDEFNKDFDEKSLGITNNNNEYLDYSKNLSTYEEQENTYILYKKNVPDGEYNFIIVAKDGAGNVNVKIVHVKQDTVEPKVEQKLVDKNNKKISGWYNLTDAKLKITATDKSDNNTITTSGVDSVKAYKWYTKIDSDTFDVYNDDVYKDKEEVEVKSDETKSFYIDDLSNGHYWILLKATDKAGNMSYITVEIKNDTGKECGIEFQLLYGNNKIYENDLSDGWINNSKKKTSLNIDVKEETSGIKNVNIYCPGKEDKLDDYKTAFSNYDDAFIEWKGKRTSYAYESDSDTVCDSYIPYEDLVNGKYYVIVEVEDNAGNHYVQSKKIKKDINKATIKGLTGNKNKNWINSSNNANAKTDNITVKDTVSGVKKIKTYYTYSKLSNKTITDWNNVPKEWKVLDENVSKKTFTQKLSDSKLHDGIFNIIVVAEDKAGNFAYEYQKINKDTKNPNIQFDLNKSDNNEWINISNNESASIGITVTDNNIPKTSGINDKKLGIYRYDNKNEPTEDAINKQINNAQLFKKLSYELSGDGREREGKIELKDNSDFFDGEYWIVLYVEDNAGNCNYVTKKIQKDTKKPTGSISTSIQDWRCESWLDVKFNTFRNDGLKFTFKGEDDTSGIENVSYYYTKKQNAVFEEGEIDSKSIKWEDLKEKENKSVTLGSENEEDMNIVLYLKLVDKAGNVDYLRSDGITFDHHAPHGMDNQSAFISVNADTSSLSSNGIYKTVPSVSYKIEDPMMANDTYSGLNKITYTVTNKDNITGESITVPVDAGARDYSGIIDLSALGQISNYNGISVTIEAVDRAGNIYNTEPLSLSIDTTKPTVNVTYKDSTGAEVEPNGRYFNNDVTMVVTVTERNFDADATLFRINGQQVSLNGMTHVGDSSAGGNGDGDTHTYEYRFTGDEANDKDYTVEYVSCTDKAGNVSDSTVIPQTFTVDKVQPTVSANDAAGYSSSALTYTATVTERNFDEAGAKVLVTKHLNGSLSYENREYPVIWNTSGDTHTASLSFAEDGDYSFTITCTDKAGNPQAAVYTSKEFTVDNVDPVITSNISEDNNNIANKGDINFEYVYTDINSSNETGMISYKIKTLAGTALNDWVPEIKNVNVDGVNGYSVVFHDNAGATKLKDGIYTIELTVKDKAGREAKDEKQFSVNRHGSAYSYISSSYTGAVILQQYVKEITDDIEVVVMNCDDITQYQVEVWNSLNEQNILKPDEDYTWKKENTGYSYKEDNSNRESGFTMYSCKIKPEVFSNEGTYTVRISTKDIADDAAYGDNAALLYNDDANTDNNMDITTNMDAAQADKIEFTVDRTNPEIVIMDIDDNGKYNLDKKFSFDYADANDLEDIKLVRKDGNKVLETITYKPSDLKDLKTGNVSAVAKEYDGYQTITVSATDKAGNTGSASVKVLVTSNIWVKYINNTPLVVATIIVAVVAAGGIVFIFYRRRKRGEQSQS